MSVPNYIKVIILIFISINFSFSQYEKRKIATDSKAIDKIAKQKTLDFGTYVKLSEAQKVKIYKLYKNEAAKIDSMKYLPREFYEDPNDARQMIILIKKNTEAEIEKLLTANQKTTLYQNKEKKRKEAFEKFSK